ncbi:hypothetical protein G9A89_020706 [Geosiphon pyriformis]|nr:hypothetical protein G9A89_020706 [Geosiphon pyriformis]
MSNFVKGVSPSAIQYDGSKLRILILHTRWNLQVVEALVQGAQHTLVKKYNVDPKNIILESVPGSFELPFAARQCIITSEKTIRYDAVICIGVLIKGATMHFEYISDAIAHGVMRVGLDTNVPCIFGVLACLTDEQALERAGLGNNPSKHNHGVDWAQCAVEMAYKTRYSWV